MNNVYLVTLFVLAPPNQPRGSIGNSMPIFRFVAGTNEGRANYLAGACIDRLADYHGLAFDYRVEAIPYVASMTSEHEIVNLALEIDV